ncbi:MAG: response regulator transcription factor [Clostridiales bacterium]|nr:response regulator transcription factor [Clostridiales bacterium]
MNLLIVDDHEIVRKGIRAVLEGEEQVTKIEEAGELEEALKLVTLHEPPDLILIDVNLGGKNGLDLIEICKDRQIDTKFVVLTASSRKGDFIRAKELGVAGYILKSSNVEDILYAIKAVKRGRKFYDTQIKMEEAISERSKLLASLTERETEIFLENRKGAYKYANSREIVYYREYSEKAYYKSS